MKPGQTTKAMMPRHILVAVDAGPASNHAIRAGLQLAHLLDCSVEIVHAVGSPALSWKVVEDPVAVSKGEGIEMSARRAVVAQVRAVLADSTPRAARVDARAEDMVQVRLGQPAKVILDRARETNADWIVLGALRRRGIVDFGSTARAVLAKAPGAVWVQPGPVEAVRRILVPVDLSEESMIALDTACALARRWSAGVHALHCFDLAPFVVDPMAGYSMAVPIGDMRDESAAEFDRTMERYDWAGVEHDKNFVDGAPEQKILEFSKSADLIVMGAHGRTGLSAALLGSVAYGVLKHATKPVLAIRHAEREFQT